MTMFKQFFYTLKSFINANLFKFCAFVLKSYSSPKHVAFIVDGNRQYSKQRGIPLAEAYMRGVDAILLQIKLSSLLEIQNLSFFLFSIFNWGRKDAEKEPILKAISTFIKIVLQNPKLSNKLDFSAIAHKRRGILIPNLALNIRINNFNLRYGCRFETNGDILELSHEFRSLCEELVNKTKHNRGTLVYLSINYSAKLEMIDAAKTILNQPSLHQNITVDGIDNLMHNYSENKPDLLIRTSGHKRYSDYYLWQHALNPLYFTDIFWPEFTEWSMLKAIFYYQLYYRECTKSM